MAEITPEERVQKIKADMKEDLDFEPELIRSWYTSNILQRTIARMVGWTGIKCMMLRCTGAGILKTAETGAGFEFNDTKAGDAPDAYDSAIVFDQPGNIVVVEIPAYQADVSAGDEGGLATIDMTGRGFRPAFGTATARVHLL